MRTGVGRSPHPPSWHFLQTLGEGSAPSLPSDGEGSGQAMPSSEDPSPLLTGGTCRIYRQMPFVSHRQQVFTTLPEPMI